MRRLGGLSGDDGERFRVSYDGFRLEAEMAQRFSVKNWFVFNDEDTFLRVAYSPELGGRAFGGTC